MKRTGRRLTLSNDINTFAPVKSIANTDCRLTTIFEDDREGYGWKIVDLACFFPIVTTERIEGWALMSVRPDSFDDAVTFGNWGNNRQPFDNSLIGTFNPRQGGAPISLRTEHVATNHLSLFYEDNTIPYYNITLEEYAIDGVEEIMFKIKETSQSLNIIGE